MISLNENHPPAALLSDSAYHALAAKAKRQNTTVDQLLASSTAPQARKLPGDRISEDVIRHTATDANGAERVRALGFTSGRVLSYFDGRNTGPVTLRLALTLWSTLEIESTWSGGGSTHDESARVDFLEMISEAL